MTDRMDTDKTVSIPRHVSIIMDGNGRWAKERGKERVFGHTEGVESVRACVEAAAEAGVKYLSVFAFSEENWNRPSAEVGYLMQLMRKVIEGEVDSLAERRIRLLVRGHLERLGPDLAADIRRAEERTVPAGGGEPLMTLVVFLSYSGKWDILQAARRFAAEAARRPDLLETASEADFAQYLVTADLPDPDLVIRTSGEQRISNYLLWQAAYAEFLFVDKMWPDFRKDDFRAALAAYANRDRRYGKVK